LTVAQKEKLVNSIESALSDAETATHPPGLLVTPAWVKAKLDRPELRVVDVRSADAYTEGHLPHAIHLEMSAVSATADNVPGMLLPPAAFAAVVGRAGIGDDSLVVLYDANWGMAAARVLWALQAYGHDRVAVLNGGWDRWEEAGYPIATDASAIPPAQFTPRPDPARLAELPWLQQHLQDEDVVIVDTRAAGEYAAGHLPGAVSWDWLRGVPVGAWEAVRDDADLPAELVAAGITPDKDIVTYCRSGVRAAHTYLLLRHLGYARVRNYDGSWLEWSYRVLGIAHG
jgi:thiosulfate/3-mercaptopyruvate sulfurtransferase